MCIKTLLNSVILERMRERGGRGRKRERKRERVIEREREMGERDRWLEENGGI